VKHYTNIALVLAAPALAVLAIALFSLFKVGLSPGHEASAQTLRTQGPGHSGHAPAIPTVPAIPDSLVVPILMYHHVGDVPPQADAVRRDLTVSTADFTTQVEWLSQQGYHTVSLAQIYEASQGRGQLPVRPVAFTFDDGYADVFANAVPVLLKNGFIGSFAIITRFPGLPDYASWNDIRQAQSRGMEIVSHTQDHFDGSNPKFNYDFIKSELAGSRRDLRDNLGTDTNILVYPYGHSTSDYIRAARDTGFVLGLSVNFGKRLDPLNLMAVPRVRVHGNESMEKFRELVQE
jgi:peptidoglycan/xylan/chitin deacetylase (PgdA/CDA1 family)